MNRFRTIVTWPSIRPLLLLAALIAVFAIADGSQHRFLTLSSAYGVLQQFALLGPLALALGLTMMAGEFDLSIGGIVSFAGCAAVIAGATHPVVGIAAAIVAGALAGLTQAAIMTRLRLHSVGVTLGGLLTLGGLAYVITDNQTIIFPHMNVVMAVTNPIWAIFSLRSLVAIAMFAVAAFLASGTRWGRDLLATGSDRRAARVAGVRVDAVLCVTFCVAGMINATTGALLSFSLAAASPVGLAETLVPAAAAAIIGGVSLSGGRGRPTGIAAGALVLCVLRSGLTAIGASPHLQNIATGGLLVAVAIFDGYDLERRVYGLRAWLRAGRARASRAV